MDSFNIREVTLVWPINNIDGNVLFDTICVFEDVPLVERYINDYRWYKHFYPTMETDNTLKSNNALVITFMIPIMRDDNKNVPIRVLFGFNSSTMKVKHMSSYAVSLLKLVSMISSTICIDITNNIKVTNIELSANIKKGKPDLELLCGIVMNDSRPSNILPLAAYQNK